MPEYILLLIQSESQVCLGTGHCRRDWRKALALPMSYRSR